MKYWYILMFVFFTNTLFAQFTKNNIYGTWVVSKVTYANGSGLADENVLKYTYIKYQFSHPDKFNSSLFYNEKGGENLFEVQETSLEIHTAQGWLMNTFHVEMIKDTLVLLQKNLDDPNDPNVLKFYFIPESTYQKSINLRVGDIYSIISGDTVYKSCPKIYAQYKGKSFQEDMYSEMKDKISMDGKVAHFTAGFIVSKTGYADSLKILEGIDEKFNKQFIKVFNKAQKDWKPAILNGKPASVYLIVNLRYSTSATVIPAYFSTRKANAAYNNKDYKLALYYYDMALNSELSEESLYKRGMCKLFLGNSSGACEDWNKAKAMGRGEAVDAVIEKYCR